MRVNIKDRVANLTDKVKELEKLIKQKDRSLKDFKKVNERLYEENSKIIQYFNLDNLNTNKFAMILLKLNKKSRSVYFRYGYDKFIVSNYYIDCNENVIFELKEY